jgi:tRNA 2-thiouridine synthesizing protein A
MTTIDARGLSCPQPVMLTTKAIAAGEKDFEVLVDSECSLENVTRLLESRSFKYNTEAKDDHTIIKASKQ